MSSQKPKPFSGRFPLVGLYGAQVALGAMQCFPLVGAWHWCLSLLMAVLGHNPDPEKRRNFKVEQKDWIEGVFSGTHGSYWDKDGNLYVQDWNISERLMKLVRVK